MKIARTKNTIRGSLWGIVNRVICTLFPFVIRTVIIKLFGEQYVGLNSLFTSILQVLNLSELGLTSAVVFSMYKPIAEDNYSLVGALLNFYRKLYLYIGIAILTIGIICLPFLKYLINGEYPREINIYVLYLIYLINTCVSYFVFAYKEAVLTAYQRSDILNIVKTVVFVVQYIVQLSVLILLKNFYIYTGIMVFCTMTRGFLNYYVVSQKYPQVKCKGDISVDEKKEIAKNMFGGAIGKVCTVTRGACNNIIISAFVSLTMLSVFDNYYYIMSAILAFLTVLEHALVAGVGNSVIVESKEKNFRDFSKINFMFMWIVGICTSCLLCLYQPFMKLWVGETLMLKDSIMSLFCVYFYVSCMSTIPSVYATAKGLWWDMKFKSIVEVIANLILNFIFVRMFGILGILLATIGTLFFVSFCWGSKILFDKYFTEEKLHRLILKQLSNGVIAFGAAFFSLIVCEYVTVGMRNLFLVLFIRAGIGFLLPNLFFIIIYRSNKEFKDSVSFCMKVIRRK